VGGTSRKPAVNARKSSQNDQVSWSQLWRISEKWSTLTLEWLKLGKSEKFSRAVVAKLKAARTERGWSQERLAKAAGVSRTGVTMIENESRNPSLVFCHALARALELDLSDVISEVERGG